MDPVPLRMPYDPRLDSWRAIAAFGVIALHANLLFCGWIGVQFFFVLSGFLITSLLVSGKERAPSLSRYLGTFFYRRVLRLFPLYFGFLFLLFLFYLLTGHPSTVPRDALPLLAYIDNFCDLWHGEGGPWYGHLWTLAVEWQFYLLWPLLIWWVSPRGLLAWSIASIVLAPVLREGLFLLLGHAGWTGEAAGLFVYHNPLTHIDAFAFGALLTHPPFHKACRSGAALVAVVALVCLGGAFVLWRASALGLLGGEIDLRTLGYPGGMVRFHQALWGYGLLNLLSALILAHTAGGAAWAAFTNWRWLQYVGKISYGVYVFHIPILTAAIRLFGIPGPHLHAPAVLWNLALVGLSTALIVLVAHFSYTYLESWFLRKKTAFGNGTPRPDIPCAPAFSAPPSPP